MFLGREMEGVLSEGILALGKGDYRSKVVEQSPTLAQGCTEAVS